MKIGSQIVYSVLLVFMGIMVSPKPSAAQHTVVSFQFFYDELSPYGNWIEYPDYGYVWVPYVDPDFYPYSSAGYWVWTVYGWTWVSNYPWGWAPFHYGRWDFDASIGWFWVPGVEWAPAWVMWRYGPGYYGWAPLRPGITIVIALGGGYHPPPDRWTFCHDKYFGRHSIRNHYVRRSENGRIIGESRVIERTGDDKANGSRFFAGPDENDVQQHSGRPVRPVTISDQDEPGESYQNRTLHLYRPRVEQAAPNTSGPAPKRVVPKNELKRPPARLPNVSAPAPKVTVPPRRQPNIVPVPAPQRPRSDRTPQRAPSGQTPPKAVPRPQSPSPREKAPARPAPAKERNDRQSTDGNPH